MRFSRATVEELLKEYKACESPDYINYVRFSLPFLPLLTTIISRVHPQKSKHPNGFGLFILLFLLRLLTLY